MAIRHRQYGGIYHYHLKKCGGTSFNAWLRGLVADDQAWDERAARSRIEVPRSDKDRYPVALRAIARSSFSASRLVYSHASFLDQAPEDVLTITVLRDPVARVLSQVSDFRREALVRGKDAPPPFDVLLPESIRLSLADFLEAHGFTTGRSLLDNYLTRALASTDIDPPERRTRVARDALSEALRTLTTRFHVVGLTHRMAETRLAVASELGVPPDPEGGAHLNATRSEELLAPETAAAREILAALTEHDRVLYREALFIFESRHLPVAQRYDEAAFEARHARHATAGLRSRQRANFVVYSVRDEMLAAGLHGRDGAGTPSCRVWSGSGSRTVLYMPVPEGEAVEVRLWVHGFAAANLPDGLALELDDVRVPVTFAPEEGWHCTISGRTFTRRPFVKICVVVARTYTSVEAGYGEGDNRKRGISIDSYGWRAVPHEDAAWMQEEW